MRIVRNLLAAAAFAGAMLAGPAHATSYSTDQSDLWWVPTESGWGIQFVERGNLIFATIFVYDPNKDPIWYVATIQPAQGSFTWTGALYLTSGPYFGNVPFNPAAVSGDIVGTMTWSSTSVSQGTLTYTVNGVSVTKLLTRQTLVYDAYSGSFQGAIHRVASGCTNATNNGTTETAAGLNVTQTGTSMSITLSDALGSVCTYSGTLSEFGQMGGIDGDYSCNTGDAGSFSMVEVQINISGLTGRFAETSSSSGCSRNGWFGTMRSATP